MDKMTETLLCSLLKDPEKRQIILKLIKKDKFYRDIRTPEKQIKNKINIESPSALFRRRKLFKYCNAPISDNNTDASDNNQKSVRKNVPTEELLKNVIAYVEVRRRGEDYSLSVKNIMSRLGATITDNFTKDVTHVVFKDGTFTTYQKAKLMKIHMVSVLWIDAVMKNNYRVPEKDYPAFGVDLVDKNASLLCSQMKQDYEKVVKEETRRSLKSSSPMKLLKNNLNLNERISVNSTSRFPCSHSIISSDQTIDTHIPVVACDFGLSELSSDNSTDCGVINGYSNNHLKEKYKLFNNNCVDQSNCVINNNTNMDEHDDKAKNSTIKNDSCVFNNLNSSTRKNNLSKIDNMNSASETANNRKILKVTKKYSVISTKVDENSLKKYKFIKENDNNKENEERQTDRKSLFNVLKFFDNDKEDDVREKKKAQSLLDGENPNKKIKLNNQNVEEKQEIEQNVTPKERKDQINENSINTSTMRKRLLCDPNISFMFQTSTDEMQERRLRRLSKEQENLNKIISTVSPIFDLNTLFMPKGNEIAKSSKKVGPTTKKNDNSDLNGPSTSTDIRRNRKSLKFPVSDKLEQPPPKNTDDDSDINKPSTSTGIRNTRKSLKFPLSDKLDQPPINSSGDSKINEPSTSTGRKNTRKSLKFPSSEKLDQPPNNNCGNSKINEPSTLTGKKNNKKSMKIPSSDQLEQTVKKNDDNSNVGESSASGNIRKYRKSMKIPSKTNDENSNINKPSTSTGIRNTRKSLKFPLSDKLDQPPMNSSGDSKINEPSTSTGRKNTRKSLKFPLSDKLDQPPINSSGDSKINEPSTSTGRKNTRKSLKFPSSEKLDQPPNNNCGNSKINEPSTLTGKKNNKKSMKISSSDQLEQTVKKNDDNSNVGESSASGNIRKYRKSMKIPSKTNDENSNINKPSTSTVINKILVSSKFSSFDNVEQEQLPKNDYNLIINNENFQLMKTLKNRRSTLDFVTSTPKTQTIQKLSVNNSKILLPSIVCTKFTSSDIQAFNKIVTKLGEFVIENQVTSRTTHLVVGESKRTVNMLKAIARGCWILRHEWLKKSYEEKRWLPEEDYEVLDFSPAVQKCRLERQAFGSLFSMDIFRACDPIYVAKNTIPNREDLIELISLCCGTSTEIVRNAKIIVGEHSTRNNICVNVYWILDSIKKYRMLPLTKYLINVRTPGEESPQF